MIENVLVRKNYSVKVKIAIKSLISVGLVALAIILPQIIHMSLGAAGGVQWLPMFFPVLIGACLLGWKWGLAISIASPLFSFLFTFAFGNPMPAVERLPFMVVELALLAAVSGAYSKKISKNSWFAFPAVLLSQISGRVVFILLILAFQSLTPFTLKVIWGQIQTGLLGMLLQAVLVPFIVMGLKALLYRDNND